MPQELWLASVSRIDAPTAFAISDPIARFMAVNEPHIKRAASGHALPRTVPLKDPREYGSASAAAAAKGPVGVIDLHFQSVKTMAAVLDAVLYETLRTHGETWLVTGTGHHTDRNSHQRSAAGGVLHAAAVEYVAARGLAWHTGKDAQGHSGAISVVPG